MQEIWRYRSPSTSASWRWRSRRRAPAPQELYPARGAGIEHAYTVETLEAFEARCSEGLAARAPYVIVAKVDRTIQPGLKRKHSDGREDKYIFVRHVEASEGVVIMGPSEHN